jgi:hypothetical protein
MFSKLFPFLNASATNRFDLQTPRSSSSCVHRNPNENNGEKRKRRREKAMQAFLLGDQNPTNPE